jgi:hypothetical protein
MKHFYLLLFSALLCFTNAEAREIAGITVSETASIGETKLQLNGTGIRRKVFFKIYVGSLYLEKKGATAEKIYQQDGARRVQLDILYNKLTKEQLVDAWNDGFRSNLDAGELKALQLRINSFNQAFSEVTKGDRIELDYEPGKGTAVRIKGGLVATIPGKDFSDALISIWLGDKPADHSLKKAMLGE